MEGELKLNELDAALSELAYPISREDLREELDGVVLLYADGEEPLVDVVDRIQAGRVRSREDLQTEIFNHLPTEAVGEPGQSEGEG